MFLVGLFSCLSLVQLLAGGCVVRCLCGVCTTAITPMCAVFLARYKGVKRPGEWGGSRDVVCGGGVVVFVVALLGIVR